MSNATLPYYFKCCGIYCIRNMTNNKVYVGSSFAVRSRLNDHRTKLRKAAHPNKHLQSAWDRYGEGSFSIFLLEVCDRENLVRIEQYWINWLDACNAGYNQRPIAHAPTGQKMSPERLAAHKAMMNTPEMKAKISAIHKGRILSQEHREAVAAANRGKVRSEHARANYRAAAKKRGVSDAFLMASRTSMIGKRMPASARAAISEALRNRPPISEETRAKLSAARARTEARKIIERDYRPDIAHGGAI